MNNQSTEAREKHDMKMQNADEYRLKVLQDVQFYKMYSTSMQKFKESTGMNFKQSKLDNQRRQREVLGGAPRRDFRQYPEYGMRMGARTADTSHRN